MSSNINNLNTNDELPAFARREDDTELHSIAVWNAVRPVRTYIDLQDPAAPGNVNEARDVAEVCLMVGRPIPATVSAMLNYRTPNIRRRKFFSTQPQSESKRNTRNYGYARDRVCNATNQRWALMCHATHGLDAHLASQHGIPAAGMVPYVPDTEELQREILTLRQQLASAPSQPADRQVATLQQQLNAVTQQVATLTTERDNLRLQMAGGNTGRATAQQVTDLQQHLNMANHQVTVLTNERDDFRRQLADSNNQVATLTTERDNLRLQVAGGNTGQSTAQQVTDLQQHLDTANQQVTALTNERDDFRRQLAESNNSLTTANANLVNAEHARNVANADAARANAEVARLRAEQSGIRMGLGNQLEELIGASPMLQTGGQVNYRDLARDVVNHIDLNRLIGTAPPVTPLARGRGDSTMAGDGGGSTEAGGGRGGGTEAGDGDAGTGDATMTGV